MLFGHQCSHTLTVLEYAKYGPVDSFGIERTVKVESIVAKKHPFTISIIFLSVLSSFPLRHLSGKERKQH